MKNRQKSGFVNYVNLVNLLSPYCICFVKNGKNTKHLGYPSMKFTKFTMFTGLKNAFLSGILTVFPSKSRFLMVVSLKKSSLYEYMLTISGYKEFLQREINKESVNFVNLAFFEVHAKVHTEGQPHWRAKMGGLV